MGGLILPASPAAVDITSRVAEEEFAELYERELKALILAGTVIINDGVSDLTTTEADEMGDQMSRREHVLTYTDENHILANRVFD